MICHNAKSDITVALRPRRVSAIASNRDAYRRPRYLSTRLSPCSTLEYPSRHDAATLASEKT
jgi:hypothetical protein